MVGRAVSILARPFERALHIHALNIVCADAVSILARPFERALPAIALLRDGTSTFQSSPALSSGRYEERRDETMIYLMFQSSPALSSGRYCTTAKAFATAELKRCLREPANSILCFEASRPSRSLNLSIGQWVGFIAILPAFHQRSRSALTTPRAPRNRQRYSPHRPAHISPSVRPSDTLVGYLLFPQ